MLTKAELGSMFPVRGLFLGCMIGALLGLGPSFSFADEFEDPRKRVVVLFEAPKDGYSYRKKNHEKTISIMLYGFKEQPDTNPIMKDRKALSAFFKQHMDRIKDDYLSSNDPNRTRFVTGETAFTSMQMSRGQDIDPAKMVGFTTPLTRHITFGGGYTWGERNPAMMRLTKAEGFFTGISYDTGSTGFQLSYLSSGQRMVGWKVGGSDIRYDSIMLGTSFRVNDRMGLTATLQYRKDKDPLTTGDQQAVFTVGTRWRF